MAKIEKLKKGAATIYPATIPQAVVDPTSGKSARAELDEKANHGYDSAPKTLKEVDEAKVDKTSIVGETGQGETSVMSQKAVTDELGTKASHGYESSPKTLKEVDDSVSQLAGEVNQNVGRLLVNYVHSDNIEISGFTVDLATGTFTKASHGLSDGDYLMVCLNQNTGILFLKDVTFAEYVATASMIRYVVNATNDTFQLSKTSGGAVETLTAVTGTDLTKWHFEKLPSGVSNSVAFEGINAISGNAKNIRVVVTGKISSNATGGHLYFAIDDIASGTNYSAYLGSGAASLRSTHILLRADGFGTVEYDCTYNGNNLVIRKNLLMIKEQNLAAYSENQLFYRNSTTYTLDKVRFSSTGFANGLTIQIYKQ